MAELVSDHADHVREIERKYEAPEGAVLPDLTGAHGVASAEARGVVTLDAIYYDTADLRLAAAGVTLRRRTGGDAGWHLKLPVGPDTRDEIHAPLSDTVPERLTALVRSRTRGAELVPVVRLRTERDVRELLDAEGEPLAEAAVDRVTAQRLAPGEVRQALWTEAEVELAPGRNPAVLDEVERLLLAHGLRRSDAPSKLARALAETEPGEGAAPTAGSTAEKPKKARKARKAKAKPKPKGKSKGRAGATAADEILAYARAQVAAVIELDPAVRRDQPDAVHRMRVATRRLRSAFATHRKVLDRAATDPLRAELKWLAGELGVDRDHEVLTERLTARVDALPDTLLLGPVRARLRAWATAGRMSARERTLAALDSDRYLALLTALDAVLADPPLRPAAQQPAAAVLLRAVRKDYERLAARVERALALPPGPERDRALHEARKAAKRARYAAEAARPALGKPAKRFARRVKAVQQVLGDHQDAVVARGTLRDLAIKAHGAGETAFTWGLLHGQEEARAAERERELPAVWRKAVKAARPRKLGA
ncbi:CHAD domain-containing protein [Streptomyces sp. URMC 123]|uniref:CYTH and CHAD domain-containing protein n=1 Tax=Streptomyces sp. URMC 123 TaxID=3423403 RepID=UPI003F1A8D7A